jgi:hypothetical protein
MRPSEVKTRISLICSTREASTLTTRESAARAALVGGVQERQLVGRGLDQRRALDRVVVGQGHRVDRDRLGAAAARGDLTGDPRGVGHALPGQLLGVGVAGGVALVDPDAEPEGDPAADALDLLFFERVARGDAELEVQVGGVAAR